MPAKILGGAIGKVASPLAHANTALGLHPNVAGGLFGGLAAGAVGLAAWGAKMAWPLLKGMVGMLGKLAGGGAAEQAAVKAAPGVARGAFSLLRFVPVIGEFIGGIAAAIAAAPAELILGVAAGITALSVGIYEMATHWDKAKGTLQNFQAEWTGLINTLQAGAKRLQSAAPGPAPAKATATPVHISIDGKHVATAIIPHIADHLGRGGQLGISGFDQTMSPMHPGMGYNGRL